MNFKVAKTLEEYLSIVNEIREADENFWFRGMSKSSYKLTPSLFREKREIGLEFSGRQVNHATL